MPGLIGLAVIFLVLAFIAYVFGARGIAVSLWILQSGL
jgi:hypothetical protein